jgi:hypothetical protein
MRLIVYFSKEAMRFHSLEGWAQSSGGERRYLEHSFGSTPPIVDSIPSTGQLFERQTPVPEATTRAMLLLGFAGLGFAGYLRASRGFDISGHYSCHLRVLVNKIRRKRPSCDQSFQLLGRSRPDPSARFDR